MTRATLTLGPNEILRAFTIPRPSLHLPPHLFAFQAPPHASTDRRAGCLFILHPSSFILSPLSSPEKAPEFAVTATILYASRLLMLSQQLASLVEFSLVFAEAGTGPSCVCTLSRSLTRRECRPRHFTPCVPCRASRRHHRPLHCGSGATWLCRNAPCRAGDRSHVGSMLAIDAIDLTTSTSLISGPLDDSQVGSIDLIDLIDLIHLTGCAREIYGRERRSAPG